MIFNIILVLFMIVLYFFVCASRRVSKQKKEKIFLKISFFIIFILMATRTFSTGTDTIMYVNKFASLSYSKWNSTIFGGYYEPLYVIFNILLSYISNSLRLLIVVISAFISYSFYKFIKENSENYLISVIMFICLLFFYGAMNTLRQYMAMSIVLLGFSFVKSKKLIPYVFTVIIASLFHSTALVGFLLYPLYNIKYTNFRIIIIFIAAFLTNRYVLLITNTIYKMMGKTNYYVNRVGMENIANLILMAVYLTIFLFSLYEVKKYKTNKKENDFYLYIFIMASAASLVAANMNVLSRITDYFACFSIICLPNIIEDNIKRKDTKFFVNGILVFALLTYSSVIIHFRPEWNTAYNYKSIITNRE